MYNIDFSKHQNWLYLKHLKAITSLTIICISAQMCFSQQGLMAEYYDGDNFDRFVFAKYVDNIEDTWYDTPPVDGINPYKCSIRWTGKLRPVKTATYLFAAVVDDGIRVWINGTIIIDQWNLNDVGIFEGKMKLTAGSEYNLKVEYFNALNEGEIKLLWDIEKPKEEQSWYERVFGVGYKHKVIGAKYFFRPDGELPEVTAVEENSIIENIVEAKPPKKKVEKTVVETPTEEVKKLSKSLQQVEGVMTVTIAQKYIPKNVQFVHAKAEILPSSNEELNIFAKFMLENPDVKVSIEGHTEPIGNAANNVELSERRAFKVARYLVEQGINGLRIKTAGYGGSRPLKIPKKGEYYPQNRRVVFILSGLE